MSRNSKCGRSLADERDGFLSVGCGADHVDAGSAVQQGQQARSCRQFVVDHQGTDRFHHGTRSASLKRQAQFDAHAAAGFWRDIEGVSVRPVEVPESFADARQPDAGVAVEGPVRRQPRAIVAHADPHVAVLPPRFDCRRASATTVADAA